MKSKVRLLRPAAVLLLLCCLLTAGCQSREEKAARTAAEALLDAVIACEAGPYAEIMGNTSPIPFTDIERYTLTRMTYDVTRCDLIDDTHASASADIHTFDLMALLNQAMIAGGADAKKANIFVLNHLNSKTAPQTDFRAQIPLVLTDGTWQLNSSADTESLRDAVTGGAYTWYRLFQETFSETDTQKAP